MEALRWHWHRFWEWAHQVRALRIYPRWKHHQKRSEEHGKVADQIGRPAAWRGVRR